MANIPQPTSLPPHPLLLPILPPPRLTRPIPALPGRPNRLPYHAPFRTFKSKSGTDDDAELDSWRVETFCFPCAKPRRCPDSVKLVHHDRNPFDPNEDLLEQGRPSPEELKQKAGKLLERLRETERACELERESGLGDDLDELDRRAGEQDDLLTACNRYYRVSGGGKYDRTDGVTLVFFHGNGFTKEMWEPTMRAIIQYTAMNGGTGGPQVEEIWALDAVAQGDSAILNDGFLGPMVGDWQDQARDYLQFLTHFLPATSTPGPLASSSPTPSHDRTGTAAESAGHPTIFSNTTFQPDILPPRSDSTSDRTANLGKRKLFLCGHSMGGSNLISILADLFNPPSTLRYSEFFDLFEIVGTTLIDPVVKDPSSIRQTSSESWVVSRALKRRPRWEFGNGDRDGKVEMEVRKSLSNLVGSWDVDVTERYLSLGLWKDPDPLRKERGLALKCLPNLEANAYTSVRHTHGFLSLRYLPSALPILVIFPAKSDSVVYLAGSLPGFVRDLPQQLSEVKWFDGYGHMIPFQDPALVGGEIGEFIRRSLGDERRATRSKL